MLKIGNTVIDSHLMLAPLAGVSDLPFRLISRKYGCKFAFTEMISTRAMYYKNKNTLKMLESSRDDKPLGVQILGDEPAILKDSLKILKGFQFDVLDFNAACPVGKVSSRNKGAGLLKNPDKLIEQLSVVIENTDVPVTLKIRSGWDEGSVNAVHIATQAERAGAKAVFLHGRTKVQGYAGKVDYTIIKEVKKAVRIPVIASGDNVSPQMIKKMFDETGCDAVTIARGALGNPWIFGATEKYLGKGLLPPPPTAAEITDTMKEHLSLLKDFYGEKKSVAVFRKFFAWYSRNFKKAKILREKASKAANTEDMLNAVEELKTKEYLP
ncbi:MAG: tRNA dihydrouridine synthase DusB [Candidatus Aureabacteria bacterium]|nr:tRNA dihydrouridine synthase DusB [Candidatus Auribacterota bacterium]